MPGERAGGLIASGAGSKKAPPLAIFRVRFTPMSKPLVKRPLFLFLVCLAGLIVLVPLYFYLLTTSVFDCAPVDSPELAPAGKSGPAIDAAGLPALFPAYREWSYAESNPSERSRRLLPREVLDALDSLDPANGKAYLAQTELALAAAKELATSEGNWENSYDGEANIHSWQPSDGVEIVELAWTLLLRAQLLAMDQNACLENLREVARLASHIRELDQHEDVLNRRHHLEQTWFSTILLIAVSQRWAMDDAVLAEWLENLALPKAEHDRHIANCLRGELLLDATRIRYGHLKNMSFLSRLKWRSLRDSSTWESIGLFWVRLRTQPNRYVRHAMPYSSAAIQQSSLPATARTLPVTPSPTAWQNWSPAPNAGAARMLVELSDGRLQRILSEADNAAAHRGITLTALAILRYRLANEQRWPGSLAELVPNYLPEVPVDAYDGNPLRYHAESGKLWSIGKDGVDDGGLGKPLGRPAIYLDTESQDIVLDLQAWCREKPGQ